MKTTYANDKSQQHNLHLHPASWAGENIYNFLSENDDRGSIIVPVGGWKYCKELW